MKNNPRIISKSRRNAKISLSKRKKLIFFVIKKSYSIGKAASRLKVKLSTAKMIVKRYKIDGTFFEPKFEQTRRLKSQSERRETSSDNDFKREEELPVKVEEQFNNDQNLQVKMEQREYPTFLSRIESLEQPTTPSWTFLYGECPQFYDGYMIQTCPGMFQGYYSS